MQLPVYAGARAMYRLCFVVKTSTHWSVRMPAWQLGTVHAFTRRRRSAFPITETELKLIAAAAIMGLNSKPEKG